MKILHLSSEKTWRGGEQQIAYLIEELSQQGVKNLVACRKNSAFEDYCKRKELRYFSLPFSNSLDFRTAAALKKICKSEAPNLMHLHSSKSHGIAVLSGWIGNRTPMVLSRRVDFPLKKNWLSQQKYNHSNIRRILCVSDAIKAMVQEGIRDQDKATTVYSGIDLKKFATTKGTSLRTRFNIPENFFLVGNTSAIAPHKDYYTFVNTVEELEKAHFPAYYFIIGSGPLEQEIKAYVEEKGLDKKIIFTGFLSNINEVLPELDLFLMTSKTEGLGTSLLDAFACKVPVVATAAGGIPEIVQHKKTGLLAPVGNSIALSQEVQQLLQSPNLRGTLVKNAYQLVQQFDKNVTAQKTLEIYRKVLHEFN